MRQDGEFLVIFWSIDLYWEKLGFQKAYFYNLYLLPNFSCFYENEPGVYYGNFASVQYCMFSHAVDHGNPCLQSTFSSRMNNCFFGQNFDWSVDKPIKYTP